MKQIIKTIGFAALMLLSILPAYTLPWDNEPEVFQVNRLPGHATLVPYNDAKTALEGKAASSPYYFSLNGTWKFSIADNPVKRPEKFYLEDFNVSEWKNIKVPGNWQTQGFDYPIYTNITYPWTGREYPQPPKAPSVYNPVGSYKRTFTLPDTWQGREVFLFFLGVESAFNVWINGRYVGYSEDSFAPDEFKISDFLRKGTNSIAVEVFRWSDASWLEDQDFIRLSGIFRDVYLYSTPQVHIRDFEVIADCVNNYTDGDLSVKASLANYSPNQITNYKVELALYNGANAPVFPPERISVESIEANNTDSVVHFRKSIVNPAKWSAEYPNLYTVVVSLIDSEGNVIEAESCKTGFRTFELKEGKMMLNGKVIEFYGVNRHEIHPDTGRTLDYQTMLQDVKIMKQNNINAVRTSHYPDNPLWYDLCDEYGLYMIDEANLESHGASTQLPDSDPKWYGSCLDRIQSVVERDKNHPSVLIWSLGNEAGSGEVFKKMAAWVHGRRASWIVHYEGDNNAADIQSYMYASPNTAAGWNNSAKPLIFCEYAHAMGNSNGNLYQYTDAFENNPKMQGGFIWDFVDQGLRHGNTTFFDYGGDWGDKPNDDNFCANGIVLTDRRLKPQVLEVKKCYQNIKVKAVDLLMGKVEIKNYFLFTNVNEYTAAWKLSADDKKLSSGTFSPEQVDIPPQSSKTITIDFGKPKGEPGVEYWLSISFSLKQDTKWAKAGYETAAEQFEIPLPVPDSQLVDTTTMPALKMNVVDGNIAITGTDFEVGFSKTTGTIISYTCKGTKLLSAGPVPNFWRPPTDNDRGNRMPNTSAVWRNAGADRIVKSVTSRIISGSQVKVEVNMDIPTSPVSTFTAVYSVFGSGDVVVDNTFVPGADYLPEIPEIGTLLTLPVGLENITYYGRGPEENYCDRKTGYDVNVYKSTVDAFFFPYIEPQETGNRTDVRWVTLTNDKGIGLLASGIPTMEFNALHYRPTDLEGVKHPYELKRRDDITLRLNYRQMGVGGDNSWGARPHNEFIIWPDRPVTFTYRLSPVTGKGPGPMELSKQQFVPLYKNIAIGKPVTTDSEQTAKGNTANKAVDSDPETKWTALDAKLGHWLKVDLGAVHDLSGTKTQFEFVRDYRYRIEVSNDDIKWEMAAERTKSGAANQIYENSFKAIARYVRITVTGFPLYPSTSASIEEFEIYEKRTDGTTGKSTATLAPNPAGENLALKKAATASSEESTKSNFVANGNDGNIATRWCAESGTTPQWYRVDLGANCDLTGSVIAWEFDRKNYNYKIEVSTDDKNWIMAVDKTKNTENAQKQIDNFNASNVRYVRITLTALPANVWASFFEFEVYGNKK